MSCCTAQFRGILGILNLPHVGTYQFIYFRFIFFQRFCTIAHTTQFNVILSFVIITHARTHTEFLLSLLLLLPAIANKCTYYIK